jgi:hypothetical protein
MTLSLVSQERYFVEHLLLLACSDFDLPDCIPQNA